jgi:hypothetical protein
MEAQELSLESPVFAAMLYRLEKEINDTIRDLIQKGLTSGNVSAKIKIGLMSATDENGEIHNTVIFEPKVTSKIESTYEEKIGVRGGRVEIGEDGQIIFGNKQISMDELMKEQKGA